MANYYATTRSNYFRVKDAEAFKVWCSELNLEFWTEQFPEHPGDTFYAISAGSGDGGWPSTRWGEDEDPIDIDMETEIPKHLDPRDVAILLEVGNEKLRYVTGYAIAIHAEKPPVYVNISSIVDKAREEFGADVNITAAQY